MSFVPGFRPEWRSGLSSASGLWILLCCAGLAQAEPSSPKPVGELIDIGGGHRVHLYCTGSGNPTVVVTAAAFSFDWGLVQPEVARFTRICTYDPSGSVWSDPVPQGEPPNCSDVVHELRSLLRSARIEPPYVLVGYSIGGLYARLYTALFPGQVAGMVIVDHAFLDVPPHSTPVSPPAITGGDSPPVLLSRTPIALDLADDVNFKKLPEVNQELHHWAMSLHLLRPTVEAAAECQSEIDSATSATLYPLGAIPLSVISTRYGTPNYDALQKRLLALSRNSRQVIAEESSHMVILDQPELVVRAIREVVDMVRQR